MIPSNCYNVTILTRNCYKYVPKHSPITDSDINELYNFVIKSTKLLVVTGAGVSTESGLPDYRSEGVGLYARNRGNKPYVPVQYQKFVRSKTFRHAYWLRNFLGWPVLTSLSPNETHLTLAKFEKSGRLLHIVTQNVDGLHTKAGCSEVIELHGSAHRIICLNCNYKTDRNSFQNKLQEENPRIRKDDIILSPDGYTELKNQDDEKLFVFPDCPECGGILKPDIVFFGENVPKARVTQVDSLVKDCGSLLVLGSTLTVLSSFRIVSAVSALKKPIAIVNIGPTRADSLANLKIERRCGAILPIVYNLLENEITT